MLELSRGHGTGSGRSEASTEVVADSPGGDAARSAVTSSEALAPSDQVERKVGAAVEGALRPSHDPRKRAPTGTNDLENANLIVGKAIVKVALFRGQLVDRSHFFRNAGHASMDPWALA
jgi:hypothetical protein